SGTWTDLNPAQIQSTAITARGFTEHEHLNAVQLIHMNGRVYDYQLGRFLSVDPFIQFPLNSQSLNPYSYIMNNPLAGTDPTGYCEAETGTHITNCAQTEAVYSDGSTKDLGSINQKNPGEMASALGFASQFNGGNSNGAQQQTPSPLIKPEVKPANPISNDTQIPLHNTTLDNPKPSSHGYDCLGAACSHVGTIIAALQKSLAGQAEGSDDYKMVRNVVDFLGKPADALMDSQTTIINTDAKESDNRIAGDQDGRFADLNFSRRESIKERAGDLAHEISHVIDYWHRVDPSSLHSGVGPASTKEEMATEINAYMVQRAVYRGLHYIPNGNRLVTDMDVRNGAKLSLDFWCKGNPRCH
ncbi:MAG: hypothetical protein JSR26_08865, partial [Proteobacteria bacterium]|nr:hypothetical protein [Pseudomonadota bacterium]